MLERQPVVMAIESSSPESPLSGSDSRRALPRKFGRYVLFDFIGKGGMAEIYLARTKTELGGVRLSVVKQIIPEFASHPDFAEMLIHEAKLAARLNHANIVQVFDLGRETSGHDDVLYIAMEYVEGFDLAELLRRCTKARVPLPLEFALGIVANALRGLDYAHRRTSEDGQPLAVVHRDVSPSNVLISFEGEVKLCDFGIAHANDLVASRVSAVVDPLKGKAGYMSPEHARGEKIDARADVFAVGIVLWELLAGRRLYKSDGDKPSLLEQARRAEVPPLPERAISDYPRLKAIVEKGLAVDRDARYPSAAAMLRDLEAYMAETKLVASPLRLGEWLVASFGTGIVEERRARERAAARGELADSAPSGRATSADAAMNHHASSTERIVVPEPPPLIDRAPAPPSSVQATVIDLAPGSRGSLEPPVVSRREPFRIRGKVALVAWIAIVLAFALAIYLTR
jgi:eukaryotic-like serine/threonine-protein kinase